jgi:hypothetical protein
MKYEYSLGAKNGRTISHAAGQARNLMFPYYVDLVKQESWGADDDLNVIRGTEKGGSSAVSLKRFVNWVPAWVTAVPTDETAS